MSFEVVFRERLPQEVLDELDQHNATLSGYLDEQHKEDGSHGNITADSVAVTGGVTAGGDVTAEGNATFNGEGPHTFGAIQLRPNLSNTLAPSYEAVKLGDHWAVAVGDHLAGTSKGLNFFDLTRSAVDPVLTLYYHTVNGEYVFMPRPTLMGGVALGDPAGFNESYNHVVTRNGYYERRRMVPMGEWQSYTPSWISSGTQPNLGTGGAATGRYALIGNTMHVRARVTLGTGFSFGTGTHGVTFPNLGLSPLTPPRQMLTARYVGTDTYVQVAYVVAISGIPTMPFITGTGPIALVSSSSPFTFAAGDTLEIGGTVELA